MVACIKHGVKIAGIQPEIVVGFIIAKSICAEFCVDCVLTACKEGKHMPKSKHLIGHAIDIRKRDLPADKCKSFYSRLAVALGPEFDLVEHDKHWHVEFDPKH